jgi:hypothetical protein
MAVSQQFLLCDNSTVANYKNWAVALSNFVRTAGWTNSSDTGQLNGGGAGPGGWASVVAAPGSGAFNYEVFQPGDGLQTFYLKLEYGNTTGSTNSPTLRVTLSTSTNGAGTPTGFVLGPYIIAISAITAPSTTTPYECDLSGDSGRLSFLLWRNAPNQAPQVLAIQRSLNASGATYGTSSTGHVTLWYCGYNGSGSTPTSAQQSMLFGVGVGPLNGNTNQQSNNSVGWLVFGGVGNSSQSFNGSIPCMFSQPSVGIFDYPCTVIGAASASDLTEGVPFTITNQYGQTKTYMPTRVQPILFATSPDNLNTHFRVTTLVEYD